MILILLFITGIFAGIINTLAGGGSAFVLPVLIFSGLASPIANATNRIAILLQNFTAVNRFSKGKKLSIKPIIPITIAAVFGAVFGSYFAVNIESAIFDKVLAIVFIFLLIIMIIPKKSTKSKRSVPKWLELLIFFGVGFYGGFIQAGVGFLLLASLNLVEDKNLVEANASKVFIVFCYTIIAVIIFIISGKIVWKQALVLAAGNSLGAYLGVKLALRKGEKIIKIILTFAVLSASIKLSGLFDLIKNYLGG